MKMKKVLIVLFALCAVVSAISIIPPDDDEDYAESGSTSQSQSNGASKFCPQCLYDHNGNRVNSGCVAEQPPKCDKGSLVSTSVGEDYEMCCCNFSNYLA